MRSISPASFADRWKSLLDNLPRNTKYVFRKTASPGLFYSRRRRKGRSLRRARNRAPPKPKRTPFQTEN